MTSSRKKHHPPAGSGTAGKSKARPAPKASPARWQPTAPPVRTVTRRQLVIRVIAVVGAIAGFGMILIGVTPGIAGGWGKLLLVAPGALIMAGSWVAFAETTSRARSLRHRG